MFLECVKSTDIDEAKLLAPSNGLLSSHVNIKWEFELETLYHEKMLPNQSDMSIISGCKASRKTARPDKPRCNKMSANQGVYKPTLMIHSCSLEY